MVPKLPGSQPPESAWIEQSYRQLGGIQSAPVLRPRGWDISTRDGLIVELDEEQHFNRYRSVTLRTVWASTLPWSRAYLEYCDLHEETALRKCSGVGFWESPGSVAQFGSAGLPRELIGPGSPRWKQRALYDSMRDAAAAAGRVQLARLSVYDDVGGVRLGTALRDLRRLDRGALAELIAIRTAPPSSSSAGGSHDMKASVAVIQLVTPPSEQRASSAATYDPKQLAQQLGYRDESRPGKVVRDYLRTRYPDHPKNGRWLLDEEQAADVLANVPRKS